VFGEGVLAAELLSAQIAELDAAEPLTLPNGGVLRRSVRVLHDPEALWSQK
jgi:hypothetical protein